MDGLFSRPLFTGFGPVLLDPTAPPPALVVARGRRPAALRAKVREKCPRRPGVYGMLDRDGRLVYVGKAKALRARLLSYFRPKSRDRKAARIIQQTRTLVWEEQPSEFAALLRELELIRRWRPRFNVQGQPHRHRRTYICVGRRPAPHVFLATRPPASALACYGPLPAGGRAREAVRRLNDAYGLRDCPHKQAMLFADQGELFPQVRAAGCIRYEIGTCLGPCAAACTRAAYGARVRDVRTFLDGGDPFPVQALRQEMEQAAAAFAFERAAALRDRLQTLEWLLGHLERLRHAREQHSFVYPVSGADGAERWYLIHQGRVSAVVAVPRDERSSALATKAIETVYSRRLPPGGALAAHEVDGVLLVSAWFRKYPEERARALTPEQARVACVVDGERAITASDRTNAKR